MARRKCYVENLNLRINVEFTTKFITPENFPLVIEPGNKRSSFTDFLKLLQEKNGYFKEQLLKHGALLFRHFPIHSAEAFGAMIKSLNTGKFIDYIGGDSPRKKIKQGIYTSTEAPPTFKIPLHNELSFVKNYPGHIYFYCDIPPKEHGETIIADARKVYKAIDDEVKKRFTQKGLQYVSCYYHKSPLMDFINKIAPSHKKWKDVFESEDKLDVEKKCYENEFAYKWNKNDWIQISQVRPAVISHPLTDEMVWFNQAHLFDFNPKFLGFWKYLCTQALYCRKHTKLHQVFFADKTRIPREDLYYIMDVLDKNTVYFPWQKGDVLVLDNVLSMHGRAPFNGKRRILTAMTN